MSEAFIRTPVSWVIGPQPTKPPVNSPRNPLTSSSPPIYPNSLVNKVSADAVISYYLSLVPSYDLSGYVPKTSPPAMTGSLILPSITRNPLNAISKAEVDALFASGALQKGDIVRTPITGSYTGMLLANGSTISQTTYASLYSVIGSMFNIPNQYLVQGKPWCQQYLFNTTQSANITGWAAGTSLPNAIVNSQAVVTKSRVYLLGGNGAIVIYAPINSDGTLGAWTTDTSLPVAITSCMVLMTSSRVYILGGNVSGASTSTVYYAAINTDGSLGAWTSGTALPAAVRSGQVVVTSSRVYLIGLTASAAVTTIYTAVINSDDTLGEWTTGPALPTAVTAVIATLVKNRVYVFGGLVAGIGVSTVYYSPINSDGTLGAWVAGTALPVTIYASQSITTANKVYILGGNMNEVCSAAVYYATINADSTLGAWTAATALSVAVAYSQVITTNSKVFLLGSMDTSGPTTYATVISASFAGGYNDYTTLSPIINTPAGNFTLPNFTTVDAASPGLYSYIVI